MGRNSKNFSDFTYGVGLEINASSFKQVKDDLKLNMKHLAKMVREYGENMELDPDFHLSKIIESAKQLKSIIDGIDGSNNAFSGFVDKGVLDRIATLENSLGKIAGTSEKTKAAADDLKASINGIVDPLKAAGEVKLPGTFNNLFGDKKDNSEAIKNVQHALQAVNAEITKLNNLSKEYNNFNDKRVGSKLGTNASIEDVKTWISEYQVLIEKLKDTSSLNTVELSEVARQTAEACIKIQNAFREAEDLDNFPEIDSLKLSSTLKNVVKILSQNKEKIQSYKQDLTTQLQELNASQAEFLKSKGLDALPGVKDQLANITGQVKITPKIVESEWTTIINTVIGNITPNVKPIKLTPTFIHSSPKSIEKELGADTTSLTHNLKVNFKIDTVDQKEFEQRISNIDKLIRSTKKKLEEDSKFKVSFTYEDGGRFKDVVTSLVNQLKNINVTLKLSNKKSFTKSITDLRKTIATKLTDVPATVVLGEQEKLFESIDNLRVRISDKLDNIGVGLSVSNTPEFTQQALMMAAKLAQSMSQYSVDGGTVISANIDQNANNAAEQINKVAAAAQNATSEIEETKQTLSSLITKKYDAPEFLSIGILDDKGKKTKNSTQKLKQLIQERKALQDKLPKSGTIPMSQWHKWYPEANGDDNALKQILRDNASRLQQIESELNKYYQRQIEHLQQRQDATEKVLQAEKNIVAERKKMSAEDQKTSQLLNVADLRKHKTSLKGKISRADTAHKSLAKNGFKSAYFTHYGEWDEDAQQFKRNKAEVQQLLDQYNKVKQARIDAGQTKPSKEESDLRAKLNVILSNQKKHIAEITSQLRQELSIVTQVVDKYNEINRGKKKEDKQTVQQIYDHVLDDSINKQQRAQDALVKLRKSQLGENKWNFKALIDSGVGDVNNVLGVGNKGDLRQTVEFYYQLIDAQRALTESGRESSEESQNNLTLLHQIKEQLKAVWQDQVRYCESQIKHYDVEQNKAKETLSTLQKISAETNQTSNKNTAPKTESASKANQAIAMTADEAKNKVKSLNETIKQQQKYLNDLDKNGIHSKSLVKLGEWDSASNSFKKNSSEIQELVNKYNELKQARINSGGANKTVTGEEASIRGKLTAILRSQKKHVQEIINANQAEVKSAQNLVDTYNQASTSKKKMSQTQVDVSEQSSHQKLDTLIEKLNQAKKAYDLLKTSGWNALDQTGLDDVGGRLKDSSYDLQKLLDMYNNLKDKKKELEEKGDTKSNMYLDVTNSLKNVEGQLTTIYQDQMRYTEAAIGKLDAEIAKEKEILELQKAQNNEEQKKVKSQTKKKSADNKKTASSKTSDSTSLQKEASKPSVDAKGAGLATEATLSSISGKIDSLIQQLGSGIVINGSNISIEASNVSVSGGSVNGTSSTAPTKEIITADGANKQIESTAVNAAQAQDKLNASIDTTDKNMQHLASSVSIVSEKTGEVQKEIETYRTPDKVSERQEVSRWVKQSKDEPEVWMHTGTVYKTNLEALNKLRNDFIDALAKQKQIEEQIATSDGSTSRLQVDLEVQKSIVDNLESQLSMHKEIYSEKQKMADVDEASSRARQEVSKIDASQRDKQINKQNADMAKLVNNAQTKLVEMQNSMSNLKLPLADSATKQLEEYERLLTVLKQKQAEIANNPDLLNDEDYSNSLVSLVQQMQKAQTGFTSLQKSAEGFYKRIRNEADIKLLDGKVNVNNLEQMHDIMQDFANQASIGSAKLIEFNDANRTATFEIKNGKGQVQQLTVAYNEATHSLGRYTSKTQESTSETRKFLDSLKQSFKNVARYIASFGSVYRVFSLLKQGVTYVKDIDSALTELKKVTDETAASYNKFLQDMSKTAGVIGSTVSELTTMAAEWARLGYSMKEAGQLAESTAILLNVSEFEDASKASEALISTMQAFSYTADESQHVVDILNEVGEYIARR